MKRVKTYISMALIGAMTLSFTGCNMIKRTDAAVGKTVLAKVGDKKITRADVDAEIQTTLDSYKEQYGDDFEDNDEVKDTLKSTRTSVLTSLVNNEVLLQMADKLKVKPSDDEVTTEIDKEIQSYKDQVTSSSTDTETATDPDAQFEEFLASYNYTVETFTKYLKEQYIISKVVDEMTKDVTVTDEELKAYYDENTDSFSREAGADAYNILIEDEETAKEVRSKIKSLDDFKKYADEYNTDSTKGYGGYLGYITYEDSGMIDEFVNAFTNLKDGEISQPVQSSYGWHIITVQNSSKEAYTATFEQAKEEINQTVTNTKKNEAYNDKLDQYKDDLKVKTYEDKL